MGKEHIPDNRVSVQEGLGRKYIADNRVTGLQPWDVVKSRHSGTSAHPI